MIYLFAAFAIVWIGLFLYLYVLARRTEALTRELAILREQAERTARQASTSSARPARAAPS